MIIGIGTDIIEISRIERAIRKSQGFQKRVFTFGEMDYCLNKENPWPSFAVRFAAKEAVMKAMGIGYAHCGFKEIEILRDSFGKPSVVLHGRAKAIAKKLGINYWHLSLSHSKNDGLAFVVAEKRNLT